MTAAAHHLSDRRALVGGLEIKLPATLTADIDVISEGQRSWRESRYFIVLRFGNIEITRWEYQADRDLDERVEPDEDDLVEFIAEKLRERFFSIPQE